MMAFPNDLFDRGRLVLGRYGYRAGGAAVDAAEAWARLKPDFPFAVPDWPALSAPQRVAAEDYLRLRAEADRHLEECETLHARLLECGIATDLVERYAVAREVYEDTVLAFGDARARLQATLR